MDQDFFNVFSSYLTFSLTTVFGEILVAFLPLSTFFKGGLATKLLLIVFSPQFGYVSERLIHHVSQSPGFAKIYTCYIALGK